MLRASASIEKLNARAKGTLPDLVGIRVMALEDGLLVAEMDVTPPLLAPNGFLHAASVIALADTACGYGCLTHLPEGADSFTTIELKSNFLGTARDGTLACIARPVHLGNSTQVWDATVKRRSDSRDIAAFRCTQMVLWPRKPA